MKKIIKIGNKEVEMAATAFTPFLYKDLFGEDIIRGMQTLQDTSKEGNMDPVFISKVAYTMAKGADRDIPAMEEWLEQFEIFDIYSAFPEIIELWGLNEKQNSTPRKK